jgi:hypothetical protein
MYINLFSRFKVTFVAMQQDYKGIIWNPITDNHINAIHPIHTI